ncbi:YezD family protein [Methylobacter sp. Wu8]|uniref:YezD family protein n=1 Tax=Methylobacter sp. Wu8 TaxID=3118457 RepID=UPI002F2F6AC4|nr:YezD family protein [Methylobacter tundripaludum]
MALKLEKTYRDPRTTEIANQIAVILQEIKFGSIEITIHENKVVQIERREKLRFDNKK